MSRTSKKGRRRGAHFPAAPTVAKRTDPKHQGSHQQHSRRVCWWRLLGLGQEETFAGSTGGKFDHKAYPA